ncbi:MAG: hypothetical protein IJN29_07105, partial [Akkermansia sp.]|nr:hypothetical protein [Akkermansia sp.]
KKKSEPRETAATEGHANVETPLSAPPRSSFFELVTTECLRCHVAILIMRIYAHLNASICINGACSMTAAAGINCKLLESVAVRAYPVSMIPASLRG